MCSPFDARPPELPADLAIAPIAGGAGAELLELTSADGTRFSAALAESPEPQGPAVVVLPDVRGLYRFYSELAERFAQAGHHAITIDYFGRTAGLAFRGEDFDYLPHLHPTTPEQVQADIAAATRALHDRTGAETFVTVGFCFGGAQSFLAATNPTLDLAAAIGFYGTLDARRTGMDFLPSPLDHATHTRIPVLGLFGGADPMIPAEDIDAYAAALGTTGVNYEIITYPGAPHSFFDRSFTEHAEESAGAWRQVLSFLDETAMPVRA